VCDSLRLKVVSRLLRCCRPAKMTMLWIGRGSPAGTRPEMMDSSVARCGVVR
jgi:hypothetical protein